MKKIFKKNKMLFLPDELIYNIMDNLNLIELLEFSRSSKKIKKLSNYYFKKFYFINLPCDIYKLEELLFKVGYTNKQIQINEDENEKNNMLFLNLNCYDFKFNITFNNNLVNINYEENGNSINKKYNNNEFLEFIYFMYLINKDDKYIKNNKFQKGINIKKIIFITFCYFTTYIIVRKHKLL